MDATTFLAGYLSGLVVCGSLAAVFVVAAYFGRRSADRWLSKYDAQLRAERILRRVTGRPVCLDV